MASASRVSQRASFPGASSPRTFPRVEWGDKPAPMSLRERWGAGGQALPPAGQSSAGPEGRCPCQEDRRGAAPARRLAGRGPRPGSRPLPGLLAHSPSSCLSLSLTWPSGQGPCPLSISPKTIRGKTVPEPGWPEAGDTQGTLPRPPWGSQGPGWGKAELKEASWADSGGGGQQLFAVPRGEGPDLAWRASGLAWSLGASGCLPRSPPHTLSPSQRGLLPVRLRVGGSPRALLLPTALPPAMPAQGPPAGTTVLWATRKAVLTAWAAKGSQQEQRQPGPAGFCPGWGH